MSCVRVVCMFLWTQYQRTLQCRACVLCACFFGHNTSVLCSVVRACYVHVSLDTIPAYSAVSCVRVMCMFLWTQHQRTLQCHACVLCACFFGHNTSVLCSVMRACYVHVSLDTIPAYSAVSCVRVMCMFLWTQYQRTLQCRACVLCACFFGHNTSVLCSVVRACYVHVSLDTIPAYSAVSCVRVMCMFLWTQYQRTLQCHACVLCACFFGHNTSVLCSVVRACYVHVSLDTIPAYSAVSCVRVMCMFLWTQYQRTLQCRACVLCACFFGHNTSVLCSVVRACYSCMFLWTQYRRTLQCRACVLCACFFGHNTSVLCSVVRACCVHVSLDTIPAYSAVSCVRVVCMFLWTQYQRTLQCRACVLCACFFGHNTSVLCSVVRACCVHVSLDTTPAYSAVSCVRVVCMFLWTQYQRTLQCRACVLCACFFGHNTSVLCSVMRACYVHVSLDTIPAYSAVSCVRVMCMFLWTQHQRTLQCRACVLCACFFGHNTSVLCSVVRACYVHVSLDKIPAYSAVSCVRVVCMFLWTQYQRTLQCCACVLCACFFGHNTSVLCSVVRACYVHVSLDKIPAYSAVSCVLVVCMFLWTQYQRTLQCRACVLCACFFGQNTSVLCSVVRACCVHGRCGNRS